MILTNEERTEAYEEFMHQSLRPQDTKVVLQYARAIEAKIMPRIQQLEAENEALRKDAERYRLLRRGQHWSVIDGIGDELRAESLDDAIDAARGVK